MLLFANFQKFECARHGLWPGVRIFRCGRRRSVAGRPNCKNVMSRWIQRNRTRAINRLDIGNKADLVWGIGVENLSGTRLAVSTAAAGGEDILRLWVKRNAVHADGDGRIRLARSIS